LALSSADEPPAVALDMFMFVLFVYYRVGLSRRLGIGLSYRRILTGLKDLNIAAHALKPGKPVEQYSS
jgi:hypothetical protein